MMKNTYYLLIFLWSVFGQPSFAQGPPSIHYQGIARLADGQAIINETISLRFTIMEDSPIGEGVYREHHAVNTGALGHFALEIGHGDSPIGNFESIDWGGHLHFLKVEMDPNGGTAYLEMGTNQLVSVPYALYANQAGTALNDMDTNPKNEIQQLSKVGNQILLQPEGGAVIDMVDDADADPMNELQGLSLSGNILSIVNSGANSVLIPSSPWEKTGSHVVYNEGDALIQSNGGQRLVGLGSTNASEGIVQIYSDDELKANMQISVENNGIVQTFGDNGNFNCRMGALEGHPNNGFITVHDGNGVQQAGMYVQSDGEGQIFADVKYFKIDHPLQKDKEIWYACIEGPEAAAYERGTAELTNGEAFIPFSDHFQLVANPETMTVIVTPLSANTQGLAIVEKSETGIKVKELMNGTGNFAFDWEVKCVRKGYEDYQVVRDKANHAISPEKNTSIEQSGEN